MQPTYNLEPNILLIDLLYGWQWYVYLVFVVGTRLLQIHTQYY